jgi:hypothetical protein
MPLALQQFTTPANTLVIADTAAGPGTLPTPAVFVAPTTPLLMELALIFGRPIMHQDK